MKNIIKIIKLENFIQSKENRINLYFSKSKIFWKDVARNYKRINSQLLKVKTHRIIKKKMSKNKRINLQLSGLEPLIITPESVFC